MYSDISVQEHQKNNIHSPFSGVNETLKRHLCFQDATQHEAMW